MSKQSADYGRIEKALEALRQEGLAEWDCDLVDGAVRWTVRPAIRGQEVSDQTADFVRPEIRAIIAHQGGWENFLDWCEATTTDALSTFDITDSEWATLHREGLVDGICPAYKGTETCPWCGGKATHFDSTVHRPEPVFPWNDLLGMTNSGSEQRPVIIALSSVFDAIQALRWDLAHPHSHQGG